MERLKYRIRQTIYLLVSIIKSLPKRILRFLLHPFTGFKRTNGFLLLDMFNWVIEWPLLVLDILGVPELMEIIQIWVKWNIRPLLPKEMRIGKMMIGESIDWSRVKIDDKAFIGPRQGRFAYVSYYLINSWGVLYPSTYVHELIHVWQFERFGSVYLLRALRAQHSKEKYDYGGLASLKIHLNKGLKLSDLNYEQQGDVLSDYYLIKSGSLKGRGRGQLDELAIYEQLLEEVRG